MRISDWSSDVCSSDLRFSQLVRLRRRASAARSSSNTASRARILAGIARMRRAAGRARTGLRTSAREERRGKIGRGAWRGRGCEDVLNSGVCVIFKKKKNKQSKDIETRLTTVYKQTSETE